MTRSTIISLVHKLMHEQGIDPDSQKGLLMRSAAVAASVQFLASTKCTEVRS